ncbi:hypothetical protein [Dyadobacter frigoris]|nr:hypothetical protein [Dyadobacter frigoris]
MKKIIGLGVVTGIVVFAFLRSLSGKVNRRLYDGKKENTQLT